MSSKRLAWFPNRPHLHKLLLLNFDADMLSLCFPQEYVALSAIVSCLLPLTQSGISAANCRSKFNLASAIVHARVIETSSVELCFSMLKEIRERRRACDS